VKAFALIVSLGLTLAPLSAVQAQPQGMLVVQDTVEKRPKVLLGFTAWGDEADLQRLARAAKSAGLANERCDEDKRRGLMLSMLPGPRRGQRGKLYQDVKAGKFGQLEVEVALLGVSEMQRGEGLDSGTAQAPNTITDPNE